MWSIQPIMRSNEAGFAGFFEDLPVMIIVLGGVFVLVLTATRISAETMSRSADERLKAVADSIIDRIESEANALDHPAGAPMLSALARLNLTECSEQSTRGNYAYRIVIVVLHPDAGRVIALAGSTPSAEGRLAVSTALMNAMDESSSAAIVEIRAMVW